MIKNEDSLKRVRNLLIDRKIVNIDKVINVSGAGARMTAFRILRSLDYLSSYSHRGAFYTLHEIADFDEIGLWSLGDVRFSRDGNLLNTVIRLSTESLSGMTVAELDDLLGVESKHSALQAYKRKLLLREKIGSRYVYLSCNPEARRRQSVERENIDAETELGIGVDITLLPDEVKAAVILFFSLLNEKQRRLYAGLEAAKLGHGGDRKISAFLGLDPHTVAKGRCELLDDSVIQGIRKPGGGNHPIEKKRRKSST